jgi:hypothetical protein
MKFFDAVLNYLIKKEEILSNYNNRIAHLDKYSKLIKTNKFGI